MASAQSPAVPAPAESAAPTPAGKAAAADSSVPEKRYIETPVDESQKRNQSRVMAVLGSGRLSPADQPLFDDYYRKYFFPRWTSEKNLANLYAFRKELRLHLLRTRGQPIHDDLNALVMEYMGGLAAGNYHPTVRVNAMLTLGELNSVEPQANEPAVPLPAALPVLLAAAVNAEYPDYLRAAAMVGVRNHAVAIGAPSTANAEARRSITTAMLQLASAELPNGAEAVGREWMLAQALESLGYLGATGENNAVFRAMVNALANAKLTLSTRGLAANAIGRLNYGNAPAGIDALETATVLARFLVDGCNQIQKSTQTATKENPNAVASRRLLRQHLAAALRALTGLGDEQHRGIISLARENQRPLLDELQKTLEKTADFLDDKRKAEEAIAPHVQELKNSLEAWLQKKPA